MSTGSKTRVATTDQLMIANISELTANYVTVTELAGTRGQLTPKMVIISKN